MLLTHTHTHTHTHTQMVKVVKILNAHADSLNWIDRNTGTQHIPDMHNYIHTCSVLASRYVHTFASTIPNFPLYTAAHCAVVLVPYSPLRLPISGSVVKRNAGLGSLPYLHLIH